MEINNIKFSIEGIDDCGYWYYSKRDECFMRIHYLDGTRIDIPISNYEEYCKWSREIYKCIKENM